MSQFLVNVDNVIKSRELPDSVRNLAYFIKSAEYRTSAECLQSMSNEFISRIAHTKVTDIAKTEDSAAELLLISCMVNQAEGNMTSDIGTPFDLIAAVCMMIGFEYMARSGLCTIDYTKMSMTASPTEYATVTEQGKKFSVEVAEKHADLFKKSGGDETNTAA